MSSDDEYTPGAPSAPSEPQPSIPQPSYQQPGFPPPVPYAPIPAEPARTSERNWMGIVALIFGVLGGIVIAVIFGIWSLVSFKQGRANNRGLAIGGLAAAGAWVLLIGIGVTALLLFQSEDDVSFSEATVGDCFTSDVTSLENLEEMEEGYFSFSTCTEDTNGLVYFITALPADVEYDAPNIGDSLWDACTTDAALADIDVDAAIDYYIEYYINHEQAWRLGDHEVICGLSTDSVFDYAVAPGVTPHMADA